MTGPIERAKHGHRLADVARRTGITVPAGSGTCTVRCPMPAHGHPDRTPSLRLYLDDDRYFCFGCGVHGDVVQWVRDAEEVTVIDAVRVLDSGDPIRNAWAASNIHSSEDRPEVRARRADGPDLTRTPVERVLEALDAAWCVYTAAVPHRQATAYLAERGIDVALLEGLTGRAEVGHTLAGSDPVVSHLRRSGFGTDELVDAGLARRRPGGEGVVDAYRDRVLLPVRDADGQVIGLVGRNVGDPRWPKYTNPPRTLAYDKSANLYQPLPAPADASGQVVVVEGTLDALAVAVTALRTGSPSRFCPVTQSGRELSGTQMATILSLHTSSPVLGFDGDRAGTDSAVRYSLAFARLGAEAAVTVLPDGQDPASWLAAQGPCGLSAWDRHGPSVSGRRAVQPVCGAAFTTSCAAADRAGEGRAARSLDALSATLAGMPSGVRRHWARHVAEQANREALSASRHRATRPGSYRAPGGGEWYPDDERVLSR